MSARAIKARCYQVLLGNGSSMRSSLYRIASVLVGVTAGIGSPVAPEPVDKSPVSRLAAPNAPSGWGVNIHFTDPQPGEMERFKEAGYRFARMDFEWSSVEKTPGQYDFAAYDRLVEHLARVGARPLFILDYGNDLYQKGAPRSPEARAAFARFAGAAVRHFRGKNVVWEIWNEPNLGEFWQPAPMLRSTRRLLWRPPKQCARRIRR